MKETNSSVSLAFQHRSRASIAGAAGAAVLFSTVLFGAVLAPACAPRIQYIKGTTIERTTDNIAVIERVEAYRLALEKKDAGGLLLMASSEYWEDSGTETGEDDYGYAGLKKVLRDRFGRAESIRFSMRYKRIRYREASEDGDFPRVFVDVLINASFTIPDSRGELLRSDHRDQGEFVLEWNGEKWMFLSGM